MAAGRTERESESGSSRTVMSAPLKKVLTGLALFLAVFVIAVAGYMASGWRLDDSIYMVIITMFGVGYGEVQPIHSASLRTLTIVVIIGGYGAVIYTVGGFMQMLIDGELNKALGARRMKKEIDQLQNHTIICGVGRMGTILACELNALGKPFVVIDSDERRLQDAEAAGYLVVSGDATEEHVLEQAGIGRAAVLANVLSEDATNVFVTLTAREMNPDVLILARGENPRTEKKLVSCGANKVVLPTAIGARKLAMLIIRPTAENILEELTSHSDMNEDLGRIGLQFHELEVAPNSPLDNNALSDLEQKSTHGFLIVGLRHPDGSTVLNPSLDIQLSAGDVVIVLGREGDMPQLVRKFRADTHRITYRGVAIDSQ